MTVFGLISMLKTCLFSWNLFLLLLGLAFFIIFEIYRTDRNIYNFRKYQELAVSIITDSYSKSKSKTYTLIVQELKRWNNLTCLQIAIDGEMLDFLNHSACRSYTTKVWMGDLSPFLPCWKVLLNDN